MSDEQLSFDDLLIDEEEVSEALLTETLIEYIRIGDESGSIVPQEAFEDMTVKKRVVVVLLAQHALEGMDMSDDDWLKPSGIAERGGMKRGSVYPAVRELDNEGIVEADDGSYRIPMQNLEAAKQYIEVEDDDD
jgi:hypothetical protein